jgi:N-acetylmuramic acid 6-phosphate (MurNAc-6-P) etherase
MAWHHGSNMWRGGRAAKMALYLLKIAYRIKTGKTAGVARQNSELWRRASKRMLSMAGMAGHGAQYHLGKKPSGISGKMACGRDGEVADGLQIFIAARCQRQVLAGSGEKRNRVFAW